MTKKKATKVVTTSDERPVIVTTAHRGVFFGYTKDSLRETKTFTLKNARNVIYWGTQKGFLQLAEEGPQKNSKISSRGTITISDVTSESDVTPAAEKAWSSLP